MRIDRTMPWLGFPPAIDLANTVVVTPSQAVDLLADEDDLEVWIAAEAALVPAAAAARGRLREIRELREAVRQVLFAAAEGRPLPLDAVEAINAASAAAPSYPVLREGRREEEVLADDRFAVFRGAVARSAIKILGGPDLEALEVCRAPSCGMLFLRKAPAQRWCCAACGNRSRVARHAQRRQRDTDRTTQSGTHRRH